MSTSYAIVEMVKRAISSPYVHASDTDAARALGISRAAVSDYKHGRAVMSAETAARAIELIQPTESDAAQMVARLMHEQARTDAERGLWSMISRLASEARDKAAALVLAAVAAGTLFASVPNQAHARAMELSPSIHSANRRRRQSHVLRLLWRRLFTVFPVAVLATACAPLQQVCPQPRALAEYQHLSHATQHVDRIPTQGGYNVASIGVRCRPSEHVTIDLLEGYSFQEMHERREVFSGRVTIEF